MAANAAKDGLEKDLKNLKMVRLFMSKSTVIMNPLIHTNYGNSNSGAVGEHPQK